MSALSTLALGYGLIWAMIGGYVLFISRKQAGLRRQLESLSLELDEATQKAAREK